MFFLTTFGNVSIASLASFRLMPRMSFTAFMIFIFQEAFIPTISRSNIVLTLISSVFLAALGLSRSSPMLRATTLCLPCSHCSLFCSSWRKQFLGSTPSGLLMSHSLGGLLSSCLAWTSAWKYCSYLNLRLLSCLASENRQRFALNIMIKFAFAQARKKKITAHMYRQLEKQRAQARALHIPKGHTQTFLQQRKLIQNQLQSLKFKPNQASLELAEHLYFPDLSDLSATAFLPDPLAMQNPLNKNLLLQTEAHIHTITHRQLTLLLSALARNCGQLEQTRADKMREWQSHVAEHAGYGMVKACPFQFWDREDVLESSQWQQVVTRAEGLCKLPEYVDESMAMCSSMIEFAGQLPSSVHECIIHTTASSKEFLLAVEDPFLDISLLTFLHRLQPYNPIIQHWCHKITKAPQFKGMGSQRDFLKVLGAIDSMQGLIFQFVRDNVRDLTLEDILFAMVHPSCTPSQLAFYQYALLAKQGTAPSYLALQAVQKVQQAQVEGKELRQSIISKLRALCLNQLSSAEQLIASAEILEVNSAEAEFLAIHLQKHSHELTAGQTVPIVTRISEQFRSSALFTTLSQALPQYSAGLAGSLQSLESRFIGGSGQIAEVLERKREEVAARAVDCLWALLRNWLVQADLKKLPAESVSILLGLIKPCRLDPRQSARLVQSAIMLSASEAGKHLPWTVIRLPDFTLTSQPSEQPPSSPAAEREFRIRDEAGELVVRAGPASFEYRVLREGLREQVLTGLGVRIVRGGKE